MPPRFRVRWAEQAARDLAGIVAFIARDSPRNAVRVYQRLKKRAETLRSLPDRGHVVPELAELDVHVYHEVSEPPYRLVYRIEERIVFVLVVLDGRRDLRQVLSERLLRPG